MAKAYLARDCGGEGVIAAIQATPKSAATAVGDRGQLPVPSACVCRLSKALCQWQSVGISLPTVFVMHCVSVFRCFGQDWQLSFDATSLEADRYFCDLFNLFYLR